MARQPRRTYDAPAPRRHSTGSWQYIGGGLLVMTGVVVVAISITAEHNVAAIIGLALGAAGLSLLVIGVVLTHRELSRIRTYDDNDGTVRGLSRKERTADFRRVIRRAARPGWDPER